jgi:hypothetical protein
VLRSSLRVLLDSLELTAPQAEEIHGIGLTRPLIAEKLQKKTRRIFNVAAVRAADAAQRRKLPKDQNRCSSGALGSQGTQQDPCLRPQAENASVCRP